MKYFLFDESVQQNIATIKKRITLTMNGINSTAMDNAGLSYKKNFGLNLPQIKTIAEQFCPNQALAEGLWFTEIRECMIMTSLLYPANLCESERLLFFAQNAFTPELQEQFSRNLFSKVPLIENLLLSFIDNKNDSTKNCIWLTAAKVLNKIEDNNKEKLDNICLSQATLATVTNARPISIYLRARFTELYNSLTTTNFKKKCQILNSLNFSNNSYSKYIFEEVNTEIQYLIS